jgi:pimeloyl-ACP methyl ester carboxylesterase
MFQISEVQESPAFNGRWSFLTLRGLQKPDVLAEVERHFDHEKKLSGYKSPLLILHTENDGLIDISHAERNHRWAGSAQKQLVRFPHGNHNTIFRSNLSEYLEAVRSFIELVRM